MFCRWYVSYECMVEEIEGENLGEGISNEHLDVDCDFLGRLREMKLGVD